MGREKQTGGKGESKKAVQRERKKTEARKRDRNGERERESDRNGKRNRETQTESGKEKREIEKGK